jgi:hypothetical protein
MLSVNILDFLVNKRGLTYSMVADFCGKTRQHWHHVHHSAYDCSDNALMSMKKFVIKRGIYNAAPLKSLLQENSMLKNIHKQVSSTKKKDEEVKKPKDAHQEVGGRGKQRPKPPTQG